MRKLLSNKMIFIVIISIAICSCRNDSEEASFEEEVKNPPEKKEFVWDEELWQRLQ